MKAVLRSHDNCKQILECDTKLHQQNHQTLLKTVLSLLYFQTDPKAHCQHCLVNESNWQTQPVGTSREK